MAEALLNSMLLYSLLVTGILFLLGGTGLFIYSRKISPELRKQNFIKYFVYLFIVLLHIFLIFFSKPALLILSDLLLLAGGWEILHNSRKNSLKTVFPWLIYFPVCYGYLQFISFRTDKVLFLYLVVVGFDGFSQVCGQLFGKTRIIPKISPNKTLEGSIGGFIFAIFIATGLANYMERDFIQAFAEAGFILIFAFLGDLLASLFKRNAGIKDFSHLIPGHGGVLDRFDSLLMAGAAFYYVNLLFGLNSF